MLRLFNSSDPVQCEEMDRDRYDWTVARCQVAGADLGALMVGSGWAVDYPRYSRGWYS